MNNPLDRLRRRIDGAMVMKTPVHGSKCAPVYHHHKFVFMRHAKEITNRLEEWEIIQPKGERERGGGLQATKTITTLYMAIVSRDGLITMPHERDEPYGVRGVSQCYCTI